VRADDGQRIEDGLPPAAGATAGVRDHAIENLSGDVVVVAAERLVGGAAALDEAAWTASGTFNGTMRIASPCAGWMAMKASFFR
jgi:hypothetical protein